VIRSIKSCIKQSTASSKERLEKLEGYLERIFVGLKGCGSKMMSATKFIDYFVHDILDYTLLNKEEKNFTKNQVTFDIREAISEVISFLQDKADRKKV